jgi:hypothetical protein
VEIDLYLNTTKYDAGEHTRVMSQKHQDYTYTFTTVHYATGLAWYMNDIMRSIPALASSYLFILTSAFYLHYKPHS